MTNEHADKIRGWLTGRVPQDWFDGAPEVTIDREEITVVGSLSALDGLADATEAEQSAAISGRIKEFRERTRAARIDIARELEHSVGRKVAWGVTLGDRRELFTTISVPVMSRLRQPERLVLDTLVDAGVARSRSDALSWCVKLVGSNADAWLTELRSAMEQVAKVRGQSPTP